MEGFILEGHRLEAIEVGHAKLGTSLNETAATTVPFTIDVPTTLRHAITVMRGDV
jgi:hypothetical protein